jgi:membrane-associated protein
MIPGFDLIQFAQTFGAVAVIIVVTAIIFAENGLLIGFFFPGDSVLFTLGFLLQGTNSFRLEANIHLVVILLIVAAVTGANVGYYFGKKFGPKVFKKPDSLLFKQENVKKAQDFYDKHGGKTIIIARFIPIVRTFAPLIAGVASMKFRTFMTYNIVGGIIWITSITYLGYFLGSILKGLGVDVDMIILPIVAIILLASISPAIIHFVKDKKQRQAIWSATKLQWQKVIERKK